MNIYEVYKMNGYFIIAKGIEQAIEVWNSWLESLDVNSTIDLETTNYPILLKKLKTESPYPCIVDSLDWETPVYSYNKN